jgi:hypothetical protein
MGREPSARLDGWKAIAEYLGRDVRTAQRWRDERGLPVHRVPGGKGGTVFADAGELDAWLFQAAARAAQTRTSTALDEGAGHIQATADARSSPPSGAAAIGNREPARRARPMLALAIVGALAIGTAGAAVVRMATTHPGPVAKVELSGSTLIARGENDAVLWSYRLPDGPGAKLADSVVGEIILHGFAPVGWRGIEDYDTLVFLSIRRPSQSARGTTFARSSVLCLSSAGKLRWTYTPDARLAFAGREFSGPWVFRTWHIATGPSTRLVVSFIDTTWWPSFVVSLGPEGVPESVFVNAGHIESLGRLQIGGVPFLLSGGVNNEYRSAALALLEEDGVPRASPQAAGSPFSCDGCPSGRPRKYFLFPRSELSVALGEPYNFADILSFRGDGADVDVSVREHAGLDLRTVYRLSPDSTPQSVAMSDRYWEKHRELSNAGKLDHAAEECPERIRGVSVRMWTPDGGWTTLKVPPTFARDDSGSPPIHP